MTETRWSEALESAAAKREAQEQSVLESRRSPWDFLRNWFKVSAGESGLDGFTPEEKTKMDIPQDLQ